MDYDEKRKKSIKLNVKNIRNAKSKFVSDYEFVEFGSHYKLFKVSIHKRIDELNAFCYEQTSPLGVLSTPLGNPKQSFGSVCPFQAFFPISK